MNSNNSVAIYNPVTRDDVAAHLYYVDDEQRAAAIYELANRSEGELLEHLDTIVATMMQASNAEVKQAVCAAVRSAGAGGAPYCQDIASLLQDQDPSVKYEACMTLAGMGQRASVAKSALMALLQDQSEMVKCGAVTAIGDIQALDCAASITRMLSDKSPEVQGCACLALGKLGAEGKKSAAEIAKKIEEPRSRLYAIYALGSMGDEGAEHCEAVCDGLTDDDAEIRQTAAQTVGQMGKAVKENGTAFGKVSGALRHEDGRFRCAAALAFGYMGESAADMIDSIKELLTDDFAEPAQNALTAGGCRARMPSATRKVKCAAACALGLLCQSSESIAAGALATEMGRLLEDDDWEARLAACDALAMMGPAAREQGSQLASIFDDEKYMVRARAAYACGKVQDADSASGLADLVADPCPSVREEAVLALAELGEDGAEYIDKVFEKTQDYVPGVRAAAITALGKMGEKGQYYAGAIAQKLLGSEAPNVRLAAIEALGCMEDHGACYAEVVAQFLQDPVANIRSASAKSLGKMGSAASEHVLSLQALRDDPSEEVQKSSREAIGLLG